MILPVRLAWRELRGGFRDFRLFLACLAVGVAAIAAVGLLAERVQGGIRHEAKTLLGGDVEIGSVNRPATPDQLGFLRGYGTLSAVATVRAMATFGQDSALVELKGVDANYPLAGTVELASHKPFAEALGKGRVVIGEDLRERFGVKPGDRITIGDVPFLVADVVAGEPDHIAGAFTLGARVFADTEDLAGAGLLQPGNLIRYNYRLLLHDPAALEAFRQALARAYPEAPWIVKTFNESNRTVQGLVEKLQLFLTLAGLSALLIGGVGIRGTIQSYIAAKAVTIATFKALGARRNTVFAVYMLVIAFATLPGILIGTGAGFALCCLALPYLARFFPVSLEVSGDAAPLLLAASFGGLTVFTFSIAALARGIEVKPTLLFRGLGFTEPAKAPWGKLAINAAFALALIALVFAASADRVIAGGFIASALVCFAVFLLAAKALEAAARRVRLRPGLLRLAVANLARGHAPVFSIMLSIGIGLSVLTALLLVEGNIERNLRESIPAHAPSLFLIDIQPPQKEALLAFLHGKPYVSGVLTQPMVRGRIAKLNGVPVEQAKVSDDVKWATESDRGLTWAALPPEGTHLTQGNWWPKDYHGGPLASLDRKLAEGMHLKVGDSITLNILGQEVEARIANLRDVNYMSLRMNFALVLSPGALDAFTATDIATLHVAGQGNEAALVHALAQKFPNLSAVRVRETLAQLQEMVGHIAIAVRVTAVFTLIAGAMVLASALAAALSSRAADTAIFKVLGARKRDILAIFLMEWLIVGCVTGGLACAFGVSGARLILLRMDWVEFHVLWQAIAEAMALTLACIVATGFMLQARAFALKARVLLRNE